MVKYCLLLLTVPFLLTACKGEEPSQPAAVTKKRAPKRVKKPVAVVKEVDVKKTQVALPIGKIERNPFKPFTVAGIKKIAKPATPLQRYQVGQFKLVAVIWGIDPPVGMVEAPDGKGFVVKRGDLIGNRNGRVARVKRNSILIVERYKDHTGRMVTEKLEIKLPSSKERGEAQ